MDAIAAVKAGVGEVVDGNSGFEGNIYETAVAFFFGEVVSSVSDDQSEIAGARLINAGKIDFIEDAMADGVPDATMWVQRCADAGFRAGSPARRDARPARSVAVVRVCQGEVTPRERARILPLKHKTVQGVSSVIHYFVTVL